MPRFALCASLAVALCVGFISQPTINGNHSAQGGVPCQYANYANPRCPQNTGSMETCPEWATRKECRAQVGDNYFFCIFNEGDPPARCTWLSGASQFWTTSWMPPILLATLPRERACRGRPPVA